MANLLLNTIVTLFLAELSLNGSVDDDDVTACLRFFAGTKSIAFDACRGDNIRLFRNITIDRQSIVVSLYINENRLIGLWTSQNATISDGYTKKVLLDTFGDVWILKLHPSDEAKYTILYGTTKYEVNLNVHVPPTANCTPTITRADDVLIASLKADDCGKPSPYVYWLEYHGMHYKGKTLAKLPSENKAGTYYACIEGPALRCAPIAKPSDYCSAFTINDISSEQSTLSSLSKSFSVLVIAVSIGFVLVLVLNIYMNCNAYQQRKVSFSFPTKPRDKREWSSVSADAYVKGKMRPH